MIAKYWRCGFGHRWTQWKEYLALERYYRRGVEICPPRRVKNEERVCLRCGKEELRSV